jgi:hypothetical protein
MDWKDLAGTLARAGAPIIGTALGGPLGGMIGGAIGNVIANSLGVEPTPEAVNNAITTKDPQVIAAQLSAAETEAQAKWPAIAEIAKAAEEGRTARFEAGTADNANARGAMVGLVAANSPLAWAPMVISVMVVAGFFVVLWLFLNRPPRIDDNFKDVLLVLLGALVTAFIQVVQYWLGSSAGSAGKDVALRDIAATSVVAASNNSAAPGKASKR